MPRVAQARHVAPSATAGVSEVMRFQRFVVRPLPSARDCPGGAPVQEQVHGEKGQAHLWKEEEEHEPPNGLNAQPRPGPSSRNVLGDERDPGRDDQKDGNAHRSQGFGQGCSSSVPVICQG